MGNISSVFDGQAFDPSQHEDQKSFEQLPKGDYILEVVSAEIRKTGNSKGIGANFEFDVLDPEKFAGQKHFQWYNLRHENEQAEKIGQQQFASLCKACGVPLCRDTDELLGKRFIGKIGAQKKDATSNEFKGYKPLDGASPAPAARPVQQAAPAAAQPAAASAPAKKMPWDR